MLWGKAKKPKLGTDEGRIGWSMKLADKIFGKPTKSLAAALPFLPIGAWLFVQDLADFFGISIGRSLQIWVVAGIAFTYGLVIWWGVGFVGRQTARITELKARAAGEAKKLVETDALLRENQEYVRTYQNWRRALRNVNAWEAAKPEILRVLGRARDAATNLESDKDNYIFQEMLRSELHELDHFASNVGSELDDPNRTSFGFLRGNSLADVDRFSESFEILARELASERDEAAKENLEADPSR